jgi:hypothetical protein
MFSPTFFHMLLKTAVLPVKWMPAELRRIEQRVGDLDELPGRKLMTPGGRPAASSTL